MLYSMSDTRQVNVPAEVGGCGVPHEVAIGPNGKYIDCAAGCEAWLSKVPSLGWSNHPGGVKLTPDEVTANEQAEKKAQQAGWQNLASQVAQAASGLVPASQAQPPSLIEQILALDPVQKAAVLVLLGGQVPALDAAPVAQVVESASAETKATAPAQPEAPSEPKRASRPRKTTAAAAA